MGGNSGMIAGAFSSTSGKADTVLTTNGDILYYNNGRQRLPKGSDGTFLKLASGLPSWAAASSGLVEQIEFYEASSNDSSKTFSFSPDIDLDDYDRIRITLTGVIQSALNLEVVLDGLTANYYYNYTEDDAGTLTNVTGSNQSQFVVADSDVLANSEYFAGYIDIMPFEQNEGADLFAISSIIQGQYRGMAICGGHVEGATLSSLSSVKIECSTSNWFVHTRFNMQGYKKA